MIATGTHDVQPGSGQIRCSWTVEPLRCRTDLRRQVKPVRSAQRVEDNAGTNEMFLSGPLQRTCTR